MKTILQKKDTSKPSPKELERVQLGCAIMQDRYQLTGYKEGVYHDLLNLKYVQRISKTRFQNNPVESLKNIY